MKHKKVSKKSVNSTTDNPRFNNFELEEEDDGEDDEVSVCSSDSNDTVKEPESKNGKPIDENEYNDSLSTRSGMSERRDSVESTRSSVIDELDKTHGDEENGLDATESKSSSDFAHTFNQAQFNGLTAQKVAEIFSKYRLSCSLAASSNGGMNA